tara:strand:+ start:109 stop:327 length:219 start_codon:yes stop_codon:yes gene_type:complete
MRKKPRIGDVVRIPAELGVIDPRAWDHEVIGLVVKCQGIHLYVRPLKEEDQAYRDYYVRRDSVEIISFAGKV